MTSIRSMFGKLKSQYPTFNVTFDPELRLKLIQIPASQRNEKSESDREKFVPAYSDGDDISGHIDVLLPDNVTRFEYDDLSVYLIGQIVCDQLGDDRIFLSQKLTLKTQGTLTKDEAFDFKFNAPVLSFCSFYGSLFKCRYLIRVVLARPKLFQSSIKHDTEFMSLNEQELPAPKPVSMSVGVDECLHIKFEYKNTNISVHGFLEGTVTVITNTLKINTMQIQLLRREMVKTAQTHRPEIINTEVIGKYEIMDGYPCDGDVIPFRMFVQSFKAVTNTQCNNYFSVRYFANLGLIDTDGRRYFKTCELALFRTQIM
eukprot:CAMPEP_0202700646 /NCGR_PEP_ID=MMETSP1385-20130828/13823_1 /ASSEMBLY_ACC=CAM_ASM_000861 /TAXON_ID=933848 /ORGANISM="Elphidium margaritaceum" /LENGTH=314 /DNA_ID=CAMNT_0049357879 /DNA_START=38 /DNA_END=982 /DNA_ORIENTATION=-